MKKFKHFSMLAFLVLFTAFILCSCSGTDINSASSDVPSVSGSTNKPSSKNKSNSSNKSSKDSTEKKGNWDNKTRVLVPSADGTETYSCDTAIIDASHSSEGYIMICYSGTNEKVKLQITGPDQVTQTYNLHGDYEVFPLTSGDGSYSIGIFESVNVSENKYATALSQTIKVKITNSFGPYLYPNQYVNFTKTSLPVKKASELAYSANEDLDVVTNVYNYIIDNYTYDYDKAASVASGYLPDVDQIYKLQTGICFDYAAVMATMLRSQGIPTRLEVGYKGEEYHAWVSTYIENVGWVNGIIEFDGNTWHLMDPTFAATSKSPRKFIAENSDYLTKYIY